MTATTTPPLTGSRPYADIPTMKPDTARPTSSRLEDVASQIVSHFDPQALLVHPFDGGIIISRRVLTGNGEREGRSVDLLPGGMHMDLYTDFRTEPAKDSRSHQRIDVTTAVEWLKST